MIPVAIRFFSTASILSKTTVVGKSSQLAWELEPVYINTVHVRKIHGYMMVLPTGCDGQNEGLSIPSLHAGKWTNSGYV